MVEEDEEEADILEKEEKEEADGDAEELVPEPEVESEDDDRAEGAPARNVNLNLCSLQGLLHTRCAGDSSVSMLRVRCVAVANGRSESSSVRILKAPDAGGACHGDADIHAFVRWTISRRSNVCTSCWCPLSNL